MNVTFDKIPLASIFHWMDNGLHPSGAIRRKTLSSKWYVVGQPISLGEPIQLNLAKTEKDITVPVFEYSTSRQFNEALTYALMLGAHVMSQLTFRPELMHVVMGDGYTLDETQDRIKLFLGFAFR